MLSRVKFTTSMGALLMCLLSTQGTAHADYSVSIQPGPETSKDIWSTNYYSYNGKTTGPGGGLADYRLRVGGWGDLYYSFIQFPLPAITTQASSAVISLYTIPVDDGTPVAMILVRNSTPWDWKTAGTGSDHERLWWADLPDAQMVNPQLPKPVRGIWYDFDITYLYNSWVDGSIPNYGIQLRPQSTSNNWNTFYSSRYADDVTLRPKLTVTFVPEPTSITLMTSLVILLFHRSRKH